MVATREEGTHCMSQPAGRSERDTQAIVGTNPPFPFNIRRPGPEAPLAPPEWGAIQARPGRPRRPRSSGATDAGS